MYIISHCFSAATALILILSLGHILILQQFWLGTIDDLQETHTSIENSTDQSLIKDQQKSCQEIWRPPATGILPELKFI